jgi:histidinol dehydrogenase
MTRLRRLSADEVKALRREPVDAATIAAVAEIVAAVRDEGEAGLRRYAEKFGDIAPGDKLVVSRQRLDAALAGLNKATRDLLERTVDRIRSFADDQRHSVDAMVTEVEGGRAGHWLAPVERAGCYAPGGRFPLVSSVLMTAVPARAAGVGSVWLATPKPSDLMLAAAAIAPVDHVLAVGGAQAIAALAYGVGPVSKCDVVVGPGNAYVTAAKLLVSGVAGIDMLAGPSELVVLADETADPTMIAADLLAQAEHDPQALPVLLCTDAKLADAVDAEMETQLAALPTRAVAEPAVAGGFCVVDDMDTLIDLTNRLAPEHVEVMTAEDRAVAERLRHYGALFLGAGSAEVFGDYGAGPNHTLPTGGAARFSGGLSVLTFLRTRTWLHIERPQDAASLVDDAIALARLEGLEGHARSAERRKKKT